MYHKQECSSTAFYINQSWCSVLRELGVEGGGRESESSSSTERGQVSKETVVLRRWEYCKIIWFYQLG